MLSPEDEKIWKKACKDAVKTKGYIPAELLMMPLFIDMVEEGLIEVGFNDDITFIKTMEEKNETDNSKPKTNDCETG